MRWTLAMSGMLLAVPVPAVAGEPVTVRLRYEHVLVPLTSGFHLTVQCHASADTGRVEDLPVASVVSCSVNGEPPHSQGLPGRESTVSIQTTLPPAPITVCISGEAAFYTPGAGSTSVGSAGPWCEVVPVWGAGYSTPEGSNWVVLE